MFSKKALCVSNILPVSLRFFKAGHDLKAGHPQLHLHAMITTVCAYLSALLRRDSASFIFFKGARSQERTDEWLTSFSLCNFKFSRRPPAPLLRES